MIIKQDILNSILDDIRIVKHLATKIDSSMLDYKPTEKQRSLLEVIQYLSVSAVATAKAIQMKDRGAYMQYTERANQVTLENLSDALGAQTKELTEIVNQMTDEELAEEIDLFNSGFSMSRLLCLMNMVLKQYAAYKMQLFLYMKAAGRSDIGTSDVWQGRDMAPQTTEAAA